jgi:MoxR-like ATPase
MRGPVVSCPVCKKLTALFFEPEAVPLPVAAKGQTGLWSRDRLEPSPSLPPLPPPQPKVVVWRPEAKEAPAAAPAVPKPKLVVQPVEKDRVYGLPEVVNLSRDIIANVEKVLVGKRRQIVLAVATLMAEGHLLLEDIPGVAKTTMARALALSIGCPFKRIQCTPDLDPAEILGESFVDPKTGRSEIRAGAFFSQIILVDDVNRASPRLQAALQEAMGEAMVTMQRASYRLKRPFMIIATQNPIDRNAPSPLTEVQMDRFSMRLSLGYPELADEKQMLERFQSRHPIDTLHSVTSPERIAECQQAVREVRVPSPVGDYILALTRATRNHPALSLGVSPRGTLGLFRLAQALAAMAGRDSVTAAEIKDIAPTVLPHRLVMRSEPPHASVKPADVIQEIIGQTPLPA